MKKTYITPVLYRVEIHCEKLIAESMLYDTTRTTDTQYVKRDRSSHSSYNVWDDDWSN